jgi:hypothetical protein
MTGFLIVMVTVVVMAVGAAGYFKYRENQTTRLSK